MSSPQDSSRDRIGILVPPRLAPNMVNVLETLGRLVGDLFSLTLVQAGDAIPKRLERHYRVCQYRALRPDLISLGSTMRACYRYASQERPDLMMNVAQPQTLGFIVAWTGCSLGIPSLVRMTGETFRQAELARTKMARAKVALLHGMLARLAYRRATRIVALGPQLRESLILQGFSPEVIYTQPQPFDPSPWQPSETANQRDLKRTLGLDPEAKVILYVGRLSWLKGSDRLLRIIDRIKRASASERCQFCIIGSGPFETDLRGFPSDLVHCPGQVPLDHIGRYYQAADLFIFPSRTEGLPNVILEAIASGLPIIASPIGEVPHYVTHTADDVDGFIGFIRHGHWTSEPWPDWFDWGCQRDSYVRMLKAVLNST